MMRNSAIFVAHRLVISSATNFFSSATKKNDAQRFDDYQTSIKKSLRGF